MMAFTSPEDLMKNLPKAMAIWVKRSAADFLPILQPSKSAWENMRTCQ
jgi:hypothetical protein